MSAERTLTALEIAELIWNSAKQAPLAAGVWLGGMIQGEFNTKQTTGQVVADAVISMFPLVGEATAARDAVAIFLRMGERDEALHDEWNWVNLMLCLIAVVPVLGGVLKGVGKLLTRTARDSEKLAQLGEEILAFLRRMGEGDTRAWLAKLDFGAYESELRGATSMLIRRFYKVAEFIPRHMRSVLPAHVLAWFEAWPRRIRRVELAVEEMLPQSIKRLNQSLHQVVQALETARTEVVRGNLPRIQVGNDEIRVLTQEARLGLGAEGEIASQGHLPATDATVLVRPTDWYDIRKAEKLFKSFSRLEPIRPKLFIAGQPCRLYRVTGTSGNAGGQCWAFGLPPTGREMRMHFAIKGKWNDLEEYVFLEKIPTREELELAGVHVPHDWKGLHGWIGKTAEQMDNEVATHYPRPTYTRMPGGHEQIGFPYGDPHNEPVLEYLTGKLKKHPTQWTDKQIPGRAVFRAEFLQAEEISAKIVEQGYLYRAVGDVRHTLPNQE